MARVNILRVIFCIFLHSNAIKSEVVELNRGRINGTVWQSRKGADFHAFLGVPYAEAPTGSLRFQAPVAKEAWEDIFPATEHGPICYQHGEVYGATMSEDCLKLNVFTKTLGSSNLKPVIVYIHGGGFETGAGRRQDPVYLMDRDVVVVTINYRLGILGFLATGTREAVGNMGLKDQVVALKWIQENIKEFGGDPDLVTISGLSAGGFSVSSHLASEMSTGLFHRAIANSGSITWQFELSTHHLETARKVAEKLECPLSTAEMIECLKSKPALDVIKTGHEVSNKYECLSLISIPVPVIEPDFGQERFFKEQPNTLFKNGNFNKVPLMAGITIDEHIDSAISIMDNEDTLQKLNENFVDVASFCFSIKANNVNSLEHIVNTLRDHYLPFEKIDHRSFNNILKLYSDGDIGYGVHRLVHFASRFTDVYYYKFSFAGRFSLVNYPRNSPYGVNHLDDLQYVFKLSYFGELIYESDPENFMVERMTRMWEQFAKTGCPMNADDEYLKELKWPKHNLEDEYYLDIGVHMVEKQGLFLERYTVWDNLEASTGNRVVVCRISVFALIAVFLYNYLG